MAVDQNVSKYMREHGPATDWHLRAEGAENALRSLTAAIEAEGYEVLMSACDASYSVRPRDDYHVSEPEYAEASPEVQKAMRHFWRQAVACSSDAIMHLRAENERLRNVLREIAHGNWGAPAIDSQAANDYAQIVAEMQSRARDALA